MALPTRPVCWITAAKKEFLGFPEGAQMECFYALDVAAAGAKADIAKPMHGMGSGVFEIALRFQGDAYRVVYAVQIGEDIWVIDAFQKKSKKGVKTPQRDIDRIKNRLKWLKEELKEERK